MILAEEGVFCAYKSLGLKLAMMTHKGKVRKRNEDSIGFISLPQEKGLLIVVADGMGGHKGGDIASSIVVKSVLEEFVGMEAGASDEDIFDALLSAISNADIKVKNRGETDLKYHGMGATAVVAWVEPHRSIHLYAGDSRLYHIRKGKILYRTTDHTVAQTLLESGHIKEENLGGHPSRHMLLSSLGGFDRKSLIDISPKWDEGRAVSLLEKGDLLLVCTDGLSNALLDRDLLELIEDREDLGEIVESLITEGLNAGGKDNISAALISVEGA